MARLSRLSLSLAFIAALIAFGDLPQGVSAGAGVTLTVTKTADTNDGSCDADCSLREAIDVSNISVGNLDTIAFNIPPASDPGCDGGSGVCTISPATNLPSVTDPAIINGLSQPGASVGNLKVAIAGPGDESITRGLQLTEGSSTIRGLVINGFDTGIYINAGGGNIIRSNFIGTDATGNAAGGGIMYVGVQIAFSTGGNAVGGNAAGDGNVISGNLDYGVSVQSSNNDDIQGNLIGTNAAGTLAIPNTGGIVVGNTTGTDIGGATAGARNVISGNADTGVYAGAGARAVVQGNYIGTAADGTSALSNGSSAIYDSGSAALAIGGVAADEGNLIAFNNGPVGGILLESLNPVPVRGNRIHSNAGLGIDLGSVGPLLNDPGDADTGPNGLQNYPVINDAVIGAGNVTISGALNSAPSTSYRLEFFHNAACDASGFGEGEVFVGAANVMTDSNGDVPFSTEFSAIPPDRFVTATATDPAGNTSEFGECTPVTIGVLKGDVDCSGSISAVDALKLLRFAAGLVITQTEPCPDIGTPLSAGGPEMGDMNCDGNENSVDALLILRHSAGLPVNLPKGCAPIGS